jgi:hypothetical protein
VASRHQTPSTPSQGTFAGVRAKPHQPLTPLRLSWENGKQSSGIWTRQSYASLASSGLCRARHDVGKKPLATFVYGLSLRGLELQRVDRRSRGDSRRSSRVPPPLAPLGPFHPEAAPGGGCLTRGAYGFFTKSARIWLAPLLSSSRQRRPCLSNVDPADAGAHANGARLGRKRALSARQMVLSKCLWLGHPAPFLGGGFGLVDTASCLLIPPGRPRCCDRE